MLGKKVVLSVKNLQVKSYFLQETTFLKHLCSRFGLVVSKSMIAAHMMDPQNMDILASLAQSLLLCGKHSEALKCAEIVLYQVKKKPFCGF